MMVIWGLTPGEEGRTLASQTLMTRWFVAQRGLAIGISATGTNLGGIVFPLLVAYGLAQVGWRETFVWLAGISPSLSPVFEIVRIT